MAFAGHGNRKGNEWGRLVLQNNNNNNRGVTSCKAVKASAVHLVTTSEYWAVISFTYRFHPLSSHIKPWTILMMAVPTSSVLKMQKWATNEVANQNSNPDELSNVSSP